MMLPWGSTTVLGQVLSVFSQILNPEAILVITGGARGQVEAIARDSGIRATFNENYAHGGMISSIQVGLRSLGPEVQAALIVLGDQPQIQPDCVNAIVSAYAQTTAELVVPSYQMRRGHPWLVGRPLWHELLAVQAPSTPRDFLRKHASKIVYVPVEKAQVIEDIDTPEDHARYRP